MPLLPTTSAPNNSGTHDSLSIRLMLFRIRNKLRRSGTLALRVPNAGACKGPKGFHKLQASSWIAAVSLSGSWTLILAAGQAGMTNSSRYSGLEMVTLLLYSDQPTRKGASLRQRVRRDFPRAIGSNRCTLVKSSKRARPVPVTRCPCAKVKLLV
jgi:hypothetical protein